MQNVKPLVKASILVIFLAGQFLNINVGWADNGDFMRNASWFSSGPAFQEAWPNRESADWDRRFVSYYIPDWTLDFPLKSEMFSSAILLWYPGVLINRYFYSVWTLHLPIMSLGARVLLFIFLLMVFAWIDKRSSQPLLQYFTIALPLVFLFSTEDIAAFFNSFYQENAAIVFIPYLTAVIILGRWVDHDWKYYLIYTITILLVVTSKAANFYWSALAILFVIPWSQIQKRPTWVSVIGGILVIVPMIIGINLTSVPNSSIALPYNALFKGTLLRSDEPQQHLDELGLSDLTYCIDKDFYATKIGPECAYRHPEKITYAAVFQTIWREPKILIKQLTVLVNSMQNYSLQLGKYAYGDEAERRAKRVNFWSFMKSNFFPKGWLLVGLTPVFAWLTWAGWRRDGILGDLAACALLFLCAFWVDSFIEILGDGERDLLKHLVMPNMFFDYLWIAAINIALFLGLERFVPRFSGALEEQPEAR